MLYFILFITLFCILYTSQVKAQTCSVDTFQRNECGYAGITQDECTSKGCCYDSSVGSSSGIPWCYSNGINSEYSLSQLSPTDYGLQGILTISKGQNSIYGEDIKTLKMEFLIENENYFRLKITDPNDARWEVPSQYSDRPTKTHKVNENDIKYTWEINDNPFTIKVIRKSDKAIVFESSPIIAFKDQYLEITSVFSGDMNTYGIGESTRLNHALKTNMMYTLWNIDMPAKMMDFNLYGSHPMYIHHESGSQSSYGVALYNSNGIDVALGDGYLTYKAIGGVIDLYGFLGPSPEEVVQQYTSLIGKPNLVPYWSLGFHNCRWGYEDISHVEQVVKNYSNAKIPLETQWLDIDYMDEYRDFENDPENWSYTDVGKFIDNLHENNQHFVEIIDPGIMVYKGYDAYEQGNAANIWINGMDSNPYLGQVWPGPVYYPDFHNPNTQDYWTNQLANYHKKIPTDGFWIDMNEASNFCNSDGTGQTCMNPDPENCPTGDDATQTDCCLKCTTIDETNKLAFPPYKIGNKQGNGNLGTKNIDMTATHYGNETEYNLHNMYGIGEAIMTYNAMAKITEKRPFLVTRSSFIGSGKFTNKWTGDNAATWNDLYSSIISIMDFSMFGIPMVGADICGFMDDTTEELCARWIEVGAFYPFSRNHNDRPSAAQELYLWDSVTDASKNALGMRYRLLPYLYSLLAEAHWLGSTVARSLWWNFPTDKGTTGIDSQFMWGSSIMISPVLKEGATSVDAYFPSGKVWYRFRLNDDESSDAYKMEVDATEGGKTLTLDTPLTEVNVHIKGGSILTLQDAKMTTAESRDTPFTLVTALCQHGKAHGTLFRDDGINMMDKSDEGTQVNYSAEMISKEGKRKETSTSIVITSEVVSDAYAKDEIKYIIITAVSGLPDASSLNNIHTKLVINKDSKTVLTHQDDCKITALASGALKLEFNGLDFNVNKNWSLEVSY